MDDHCKTVIIEDLADQPHLPADERQPLEMYHQLIQQDKRPICYIIGRQSLPKYQQGFHCLTCDGFNELNVTQCHCCIH